MSALTARETWRTLLEKAEKTRGSDDLGWLRTKEDGLCTDVTPDFLVRILSPRRVAAKSCFSSAVFVTGARSRACAVEMSGWERACSAEAAGGDAGGGQGD